eukprot:GHVU01078236.1.p1 GENE.GHVU01078236.1~~GHVU01078236.1.p1  ORF type:complete len:178 (+),score=31.12 GHVU01078236.1:458-991(+)
MTLYLGDEIDCDDLMSNAAASGVTGIKVYPKGVTTNSAAGVESLEKYYPLFRHMEKCGLTLHIHGEVPGVSPWSAEAEFLPQLSALSAAFPSLRIVLEHVSTRAAVEEVRRRPNVAATITLHHLAICGDAVFEEETSLCGSAAASRFYSSPSPSVAHPHNYCKPVCKTPDDRNALRE